LQAVFVLATVCDGHPRGQALCYQANLLGSLLRWLQLLLPGLAALEAQQAAAAASGGMAGVGPGVSRGAALLVKWCCLALGRLVEDAPEAAAVRGPLLPWVAAH
jgi:regulator-associated protein of mTOR